MDACLCPSIRWIYVIEQFGPELGWSARYIDLAATTAGAVFRSLNLDEGSDVIPIGPSVVDHQLDALEADLRKRGRSPNTISTYTTTWRRISDIAGAWSDAVEAGEEDRFWAGIGKYRDPRTRRRTTRPSQRATQTEPAAKRSEVKSTAPDGIDGSTRIDIPVADGTAVILLPRKVSQAEAAQIIGTLLSEGVDESR